MKNLNKDSASRKGEPTRKGRKEGIAVLVLDTREGFFEHVQNSNQASNQASNAKSKTIFLTATPEPALLPSLRGGPGAIYAVLSFNSGTPDAPAVAFYVEEISDVTEMEWASDFPLKGGQSAKQVVERVLEAFIAQIAEAGSIVRRGRWELVEALAKAVEV